MGLESRERKREKKKSVRPSEKETSAASDRNLFWTKMKDLLSTERIYQLVQRYSDLSRLGSTAQHHSLRCLSSEVWHLFFEMCETLEWDIDLQCPCNSILYEIKVLWSLNHQKSLVNMFNHGQHIPTLSSVQDVLRRLLQDCSRWSGAKVQHGNQQSGVAAHNLFVVAAVAIRI